MRVVLDDLIAGGMQQHFGTSIERRSLQATDLDWSYGLDHAFPAGRPCPVAQATALRGRDGAFYVGLGVFSKFYFSATIISDSRTYGTIGAIFGILTWLIAVAAVIILGAVAGVVWDRRGNGYPGQ